MNWEPFSKFQLKELLLDLDCWFLAGGESIDHFFGKKSREHDDLDIGVFYDDLPELIGCLEAHGLTVWACIEGELAKYNFDDLPEKVHNFWVSDDTAYRFEILTYRTNDAGVIFRRNTDIIWERSAFTVEVDGFRVLSPMVSYAFKITSSDVRAKDLEDIQLLTREVLLKFGGKK